MYSSLLRRIWCTAIPGSTCGRDGVEVMLVHLALGFAELSLSPVLYLKREALISSIYIAWRRSCFCWSGFFKPLASLFPLAAPGLVVPSLGSVSLGILWFRDESAARVLQMLPSAKPHPGFPWARSPHPRDVRCCYIHQCVNTVVAIAVRRGAPGAVLRGFKCGLCWFKRTLGRECVYLKMNVAIKYFLCWPYELADSMLK